MTKETSLPAKQRIWELDALRGLCILCMVAIHAFWDLSAFGGFAFDLPGVYLETNVRAVLLHELFPREEGVSDARLVPILRATCPQDASDPADDPRTWYYALLDYGAHLKATVPNPSRRSRSHVRQSRFEGSHRQKRAEVLRILLAHRADPRGGVDLDALCVELSREERAAGRRGVDVSDAQALLAELSREVLS